MEGARHSEPGSLQTGRPSQQECGLSKASVLPSFLEDTCLGDGELPLHPNEHLGSLKPHTHPPATKQDCAVIRDHVVGLPAQQDCALVG